MKKISKAAKVRQALLANPEASLSKLAKQLGITYQTVWGVKNAMNKSIEATKKDGLRRTPEGKIRMQAPKPVEVPAVDIDKAHKQPELQGTDKLLAERGDRYGKFTGHAKVTQILKNVLSAHAKSVGTEFAFDQAEALDMICHKLGRIVNGDPDYADSWRDLEGYSKLVADRLEKGIEV